MWTAMKSEIKKYNLQGIGNNNVYSTESTASQRNKSVSHCWANWNYQESRERRKLQWIKQEIVLLDWTEAR
jgi:hypothetical protein